MSKKKVNKIDKLTKELKVNDKERDMYLKLARRLKPKKVNDRVSQKTKAVTHFENGLKEVKEFKYDEVDPNTKSPFKKDKDNPDGRFSTEADFEKWKENEIKTVEDKIMYEKGKVKHWSNIKKFKEALP